jgi:hypothetical protein
VFFDDCRWETQILVVEGNTFGCDSSNISRGVASKGCGFNGLFSNYGTYPRWSPHKGHIVPNNMPFKQNSVWRNNRYTGGWHFMVEESGSVVPWGAWRSSPTSKTSADT